MTAKLDYIIGASKYEVVTSQIAQILALELANQRVLLADAIDDETDPDKLAEYELSLSCIPTKVYEERFLHPGVSELPFVNVMFTKSPLNDLITHSTQGGNVVYVVEIWQNAATKGTDRGDSLSIKKTKRLAGICNKILSDKSYVGLGFPDPCIGYRQVNDIVIGQPDTGGKDANNSTFGKLSVEVKLSENIPEKANLLLEGSDTQINLNNSSNGYYWEVTF